MLHPAEIPAIEQAAAHYAAQGLVLARDLEHYLLHPHGLVIKRPELFVLARPVVLDEPTRWLGRDEAGEANAWFIKFLVGRVPAAVAQMPRRLPFCCWHRQFRDGSHGRLHVVETDNLLRRIHEHQS